MAFSKTFALLLVVASTLAGCIAEDVGYFSLDYVNCQSLAIVKVTDTSFFNDGTVCGSVDLATANHICSSLSYGSVLDYGTASSKGVTGGTGTILATNLVCPDSSDCTFSTSTGGCTHSEDLVIQCSEQPTVCIYIPTSAIIALAVAGFFFCIFLPVLACIGCCVCACAGVACFRRSTPNYSQL